MIPNGDQLNDTGGTISAQTGTLSIAASAQLEGTTLHTAAGTSVAFDQDTTSFDNSTSVSGTLAGTGTGTVLFDSGQMYNVRQKTGDTTPTGTLNFPAGVARVTGFGFEVYGDGAQMVNAGELDYVGTADHGDMNLDNTGTIAVLGTGDLAANNQTAFLNDTTGIVDFTTDAGVSNFPNGHGGSDSFTNDGLIEKTGGTAPPKLPPWPPPAIRRAPAAGTLTAEPLALFLLLHLATTTIAARFPRCKVASLAAACA